MKTLTEIYNAFIKNAETGEATTYFRKAEAKVIPALSVDKLTSNVMELIVKADGYDSFTIRLIDEIQELMEQPSDPITACDFYRALFLFINILRETGSVTIDKFTKSYHVQIQKEIKQTGKGVKIHYTLGRLYENKESSD